MAKKKSWQEKLHDDKDLPKIVEIPAKIRKTWGEGTMLIPAPLEVDRIMQQIPKGKLSTISEIRELLSKKHKTTIACPMTTGIFAWIAANAAEELRSEGKKRITPYWRTLKSKGELNPKYPGGIEAIRKLLEAEGHKIIEKGKKNKKYFVENFEKALVDIRKIKTD